MGTLWTEYLASLKGRNLTKSPGAERPVQTSKPPVYPRINPASTAGQAGSETGYIHMTQVPCIDANSPQIKCRIFLHKLCISSGNCVPKKAYLRQ